MSRVASHASFVVLAMAGASAWSLVGCGADDPPKIQRANRPDPPPGSAGSFNPTDSTTGFGGFTTSDDPVGAGGEGGSGGGDPGAGGVNGGSAGSGGGSGAAGADAGRSDAPLDGSRVDARVDARDADARDSVADAVDSRRDADAQAPPDAGPADVAGDACSVGIVGTFYVSDLNWVGTPVNGFGPVEKDSSNGDSLAGDGHPITIKGVTYAKGLGAHANSSIEYDLQGKCTTFSAYVGADDEVSAASITFEVWVDGQRSYSSPSLVVSGQPAAFVSVDVRCATSLRLVVTDGVVNGNTADHADWADAKLLCVAAP